MKITFLTPVKHDGKDYAEGATVEFKKEDAQPLFDAGLALPAAEVTKTDDAKS